MEYDVEQDNKHSCFRGVYILRVKNGGNIIYKYINKKTSDTGNYYEEKIVQQRQCHGATVDCGLGWLSEEVTVWWEEMKSTPNTYNNQKGIKLGDFFHLLSH